MTPRYASGGRGNDSQRMIAGCSGYVVPIAMLPDPPCDSWLWQRAGYAARHFSGQIFYRIRLGQRP